LQVSHRGVGFTRSRICLYRLDLDRAASGDGGTGWEAMAKAGGNYEFGPVPLPRHCEERSDEAIHVTARGEMDCFASLAMTAETVEKQ